jgi:poly-gamma-glutamate capsule biosynthesis protein CapA/YwtB (metallophosphatase superfamily)
MHKAASSKPSDEVRLLLTGDVMLGRGVDQILRHPSDPALFESYATSAGDYVRLAEKRNGPVRRPVDFDYVWGDALDEIRWRKPDLRIINLETAITTSRFPEDKGINYRMNPANIAVLRAAEIDACVLSNNHVGDWGRTGLIQTLDTLGHAGIVQVGAGRNRREAEAPAILPLEGKGRVILIASGSTTSGIPRNWAARDDEPGVNLLPNSVATVITTVRNVVDPLKGENDIVIVSIHWGSNWGYEISEFQRDVAHGLIEHAGVDLVHGHSSHHPRSIEIHRNKLVLYGCGDFINDYEGIASYEKYRGDLTIAYIVSLALKGGRLLNLEMLPFRIRQLRLERARHDDAHWLAETLNRMSVSLGTKIDQRDPKVGRAPAQGASRDYTTLWLSMGSAAE